MLLIDDLLLAPLRGVLWVVEKIHEAGQEELVGEADAITEQLRQLYTLIERGQITEAEFDTQERELLDRLDKVREREADPTDEAEDAEHMNDRGGENGSGDEENDEEDDDADGGGGT